MAKRSKYFDSNNNSNKKAKSKNVTEEGPNTEINNAIGPRLTKEFFVKHSTVDLAKVLLGKYLCRRVDDTIIKAIIVETEAYLGAEDHASYSFKGRRTEANEAMYMDAGTVFTKFTMGLYYCLNISSNDEGAAVLLRAAEPVEGIEKMCQLRRTHPKAPNKDKFADKPHEIANGPSKLCIAFGIDRSLNKANLLTDSRIWMEDSDHIFNEESIVSSTRVGIPASNPWANKMMRYYLNNYRSVSKK